MLDVCSASPEIPLPPGKPRGFSWPGPGGVLAAALGPPGSEQILQGVNGALGHRVPLCALCSGLCWTDRRQPDKETRPQGLQPWVRQGKEKR